MNRENDTHQPLVVLADDGEPASDVAWAWLISHRWDGCALKTVTVRWEALGGGEDLKPSRFVPRPPPQETAFAASTHIEVAGDPRVILLDHSEAALLVLGSHRRRHLAGLWAGSASEWLLMRPPAPMVLARHGHRTQSVALCVDGSQHAMRALQAFSALPWSADVSINLVAVDDGLTDVEESLALAEASLPANCRAAQVARLRGAPGPELAHFVLGNQIDLAVLGTRGLTGWARMRVGSTVSRLLKDGSANLMIAHVAADEASGAR